VETKVTAIHEAKKMNKISLEELTGNLQTYKLRRSSPGEGRNKERLRPCSKGCEK